MRKPVLGAAFALCALVPVAIQSQQTVRFNDRSPQEQEEPPVVSVWIDEGSMVRYGQPVRVRYRVEDDAYVVVARVDWDGNLTLLYPSRRNRETLVRGGRDHAITGARLGARGTFVATERNGGSGYVFALASYMPFDLSSLSQRDFSSWVTGINVGRPTSRYVGDPYRVVTRFAQLVLWAPDTPFDFDVAYYSANAPSWVTASSSMDACFSRSGRGLYGYEYDDYGYGWNDGYSRYGCSSIAWWLRQCSLGYSYSAWALGYPIGCFPVLRQPQVANYPNGPRPPRPVPDSVRLNPWVADSISKPNVDRQGQVNGPHRMTVEPSVAPAAVGGDRSFAIPPRAWERMRDRGVREGRSAPAGDTGPMPMPARPSPVAIDRPADDGVRPARDMAPPSRADERVPPRRNREAGGDSRGSGRSYDPPPRTASPSIERERRVPANNRPARSGGTVRNDPPPRAVERAPATRNPPRPAPVRTEQPRPATTERKPAERKPAERKPASERHQ